MGNIRKMIRDVTVKYRRIRGNPQGNCSEVQEKMDSFIGLLNGSVRKCTGQIERLYDDRLISTDQYNSYMGYVERVNKGCGKDIARLDTKLANISEGGYWMDSQSSRPNPHGRQVCAQSAMFSNAADFRMNIERFGREIRTARSDYRNDPKRGSSEMKGIMDACREGMLHSGNIQRRMDMRNACMGRKVCRQDFKDRLQQIFNQAMALKREFDSMDSAVRDKAGDLGLQCAMEGDGQPVIMEWDAKGAMRKIRNAAIGAAIGIGTTAVRDCGHQILNRAERQAQQKREQAERPLREIESVFNDIQDRYSDIQRKRMRISGMGSAQLQGLISDCRQLKKVSYSLFFRIADAKGIGNDQRVRRIRDVSVEIYNRCTDIQQTADRMCRDRMD